ncbi:MAG: hypothetical protein ACFFCW_40410, partial [Candidatus Hodarchaeota archaeon]
ISLHIKKSYPDPKERQSYLLYKMGMTHFYFILSELLFLFSLKWFHIEKSFVDKYQPYFFWSSIVLFIIMFIYYLLMHKLQRAVVK